VSTDPLEDDVDDTKCFEY